MHAVRTLIALSVAILAAACASPGTTAAVLQMTDNPEVAAVAQEVRVRLERVRSALST
jgi:uncharacterized lipoprotein YmbA